MPPLIETIATAARRDRLFDGVARLLVGCSGGGDSVALLDILVGLAPRFDLELAVAHLHHGWRDEEADADQRLVEELALRHGLPFFTQRVDLSGAAGSREEAARNARLLFFEKLVDRWNADAVALGHTADDQLETVVFHLARGTGRRGLGGMRPRAEVGEVLIVRPLLEQPRAALLDHARSRALAWNEDSSNNDISLARNRLRRRILSDLQQINARAVDNVARGAELMREEEEWLDEVAARAFEEVSIEEEFPGGMALREEQLAALPRPLRRRVVRRAIELVRGHCRGISHEHVEWVVAAGEKGFAARDLPGVRVTRDGARVRFLPLDGRQLARPQTG